MSCLLLIFCFIFSTNFVDISLCSFAMNMFEEDFICKSYFWLIHIFVCIYHYVESSSADEAPAHENLLTIHSVPSLIPSAGVTLKRYRLFPSEFIQAFNNGNFDRLASLFHEVTSESCIFKMKCPFGTTMFPTLNGLVDIHSKFLLKQPDAVASISTMKSFLLDGFRVIRCKFLINGTVVPTILNPISPCGDCPNNSMNGFYFSDFLDPKMYTHEDKIKMKHREIDIQKRGKCLSILSKIVVNLYVDLYSNRVQLFDEQSSIAFVGEGNLSV